jgi:16S rRNA (guanine527-N7)-methyltransferase
MGLESFCRESGFPLVARQSAAFVCYEEALYSALSNVTRVPREECEVRHFIESLLVAAYVPVGSRVLDIGSGPGLPAWPLACARPDLQVVAMDSNAKMLRVLAACPLDNLSYRKHRAEDVDERERFDVVTGRAIAPLSAQIEVSAAWCRVGGAVVPFRTPNDRAQITGCDFGELGLALESVEEQTVPGTEIVRVFPVYRKFKKTPVAYPRDWAKIKSSPL